MITHKELFIGGVWRVSTGGSTEIVSPATEEVVGAVPDASPDDVDAAVAAACAALDGPWARMTFEQRASVIGAAANWIAAHASEIGEVISLERGTPVKANVSGLVPQVAHMMRAAVECARTVPRMQIRRDSQGAVLIRQEPAGVVAAVVPFNGPLPIAVLKATPALLAGCAVVVKPSDVAPLEVFFLARAFEAAGLPAGMFNLLTGGDGAGRTLVEHPRVDMVSFTGSTGVGRQIAASCAKALKKCTLELGGKSAAIVLEDADLAAAAALIGGGVFAGAGQYCRALTRVLVPRTLQDAFVDALSGVAGRFHGGDPFEDGTNMSPLNSERQRERVESYIAAAREEGARLVCGGGRPAGLTKGWYVEPTVFADATNDMRFVREEIFGPVVAVIPYDDVDQALAIANDSDYGLSGAVFSRDERAAVELTYRVRTGTTGVNLHGARSCAPCGGTKASGIGQEHGPEGFLEYLDPKAILISEALAATLEAEGVPAVGLAS